MNVVKPKGRKTRLQYAFPLTHLLLTYLSGGNNSRTPVMSHPIGN